MKNSQLNNTKGMLIPNTKSTLSQLKAFEMEGKKLIKGGTTTPPIEEGTATTAITWI